MPYDHWRCVQAVVGLGTVRLTSHNVRMLELSVAKLRPIDWQQKQLQVCSNIKRIGIKAVFVMFFEYFVI